MQIAKETVVSFHYTLKDGDGRTLDSSEGGDPLTYLHGAGNILPGLENALDGKQASEKVAVRLEPENAYGQRSDDHVQVVPREAFSGVPDVQPGMQFQAQGPGGAQIVTVVKVDDGGITVDGNHPLAGLTLDFAVEIVEVRAATTEELQHGHAHGPGAHHHVESDEGG